MNNDYNPKSCNAIEKSFYTPIEAALRWCNLVKHEPQIFQQLGGREVPSAADFPMWPCLRANTEKIWDAIHNREVARGRDGKTVGNPSESIAAHRVTVRHADLKAWMAKHYPDQKPAFLFDEVERNTHSSINAEAFQALQADRDSLRAQLEKANEQRQKIAEELRGIAGERDSLRAMVDVQTPLNPRAEATYLSIVGGLLSLMLETTPGGQKGSIYESQAAIISALLAHHEGKQGISKPTLENKFAQANKNLKAY